MVRKACSFYSNMAGLDMISGTWTADLAAHGQMQHRGVALAPLRRFR